MKIRISLLVTLLMCMYIASPSLAVEYVEMKPANELVNVRVGDVLNGDIKPGITWGGDIATVLGIEEGIIDGRFARQDVFLDQVKAYMRGDTPYLRCTQGMLNLVVELLNQDPRTVPVVTYQMTWSTGGDALVVKDGINSASDLRGKTIALQFYGPHIDYLAKILAGAGLTFNDVNLKWVKDLTATDNVPMEAFYEDDIDAALVIIPDALALTSDGGIGDGSEGSVMGAKIMLSTKTADRIISDVYVVRSDYLQAHRADVSKFTHGLMIAGEKLSELIDDKSSQIDRYQRVMSSAATALRDSPQAIGDTEALLGDCTYVGFAGNVKFFGDESYPRNFDLLNDEIQSSYVIAGFMSKKVAIEHARWDYNAFKAGLTNTEGVDVPKFNTAQVTAVIQKRRQEGASEDGVLFSFEIHFVKNQNTFPIEQYKGAFDRVIDLASAYGGAIILVEGHSDPLGYLKAKKNNLPSVAQRQIIQSAKNLSKSRAQAAVAGVINYAKTKGIALDSTQFSDSGLGITQPKSGICGNDPCPPQSKQEWLDNMRVEFQIIQIEAEASVFELL
ncbi:ABC transporter substrate-binding protein [Patescibacteria group bacterium]